MINEQSLVAEWSEARNTIARFDGYLLRLRVLAFSSFSLLLVPAIGAFAGNADNRLLPVLASVALPLMYFYISVIFILDRYYERMLMISVNRASRLEAVRLSNFKLGLTTEIEDGKNLFKNRTFEERITSYLSSAGKMVASIYVIVNIITLLCYVTLIADPEAILFFSPYIHWFVFVALLVIGGFLLRFSMNLMSSPLSEATLRAKVANSPEILTRDEIENCIAKMARDARKWLGKNELDKVYVVCILNGARPVTRHFLKELEKQSIGFTVSYIKVQATSGNALLDQVELEYGTLLRPESENEVAIVVDDLVDSGKTLEFTKLKLQSLGYREVKAAALLNKYAGNEIADFIGFDLQLDKSKMKKDGVKDYWLFGYGMDIDGYYRDLDYIGWVSII